MSDLPFYERAFLSEHEGKPCVIARGPDNQRYAVELDGTGKAIHSANVLGALILNRDNIAAYVAFFTNHLKTDGKDNLSIVEQHERLGDIIHPLRLDHIDDDGLYHLTGFVKFEDGIFRSVFLASQDGNVVMTNNELVAIMGPMN
jgi:hypothetical protein